MNEKRRLYRSLDNRKIAGVCGGLADYFDIDPTMVRLAWVIFTLAGGAGILAYIIAWILIPEQQSA
jgi:phage shock protein C